MEASLAVGGFILGIVGILLTIYYARKAERLNRLRKRLEWADLRSAAGDLGARIKRDFDPVALVTPGLTGATFANLLVTEFDGQPPVFVGTRTWKEDSHTAVRVPGSFSLETKKWHVTVPDVSQIFKDGTVLIVDDFVMSGDFLDMLRTELINSGMAPERIQAASIATTKVAIRNHKSPDYYWWVADDDDFYFPWGKAK